MSEQKRRHLPGWWILVIFPLFGILVAILTFTGLPGNSLKGNPATGKMISMGEPAPDFTASTLDGHNVRLSNLKGSIVALSFWASWCEPCQTELPEWQKAAQRYPSPKLVVLAINAGEADSAARTFLRELNIDLPVVLDPNKAIQQQYGVSVLPVTFWVDTRGVLQQEYLGALDSKTIDRTMASLTGKP